MSQPSRALSQSGLPWAGCACWPNIPFHILHTRRPKRLPPSLEVQCLLWALSTKYCAHYVTFLGLGMKVRQASQWHWETCQELSTLPCAQLCRYNSTCQESLHWGSQGYLSSIVRNGLQLSSFRDENSFYKTAHKAPNVHNCRQVCTSWRVALGPRFETPIWTLPTWIWWSVVSQMSLGVFLRTPLKLEPK